jgi:hypothetical protein
MPKRMRDVLSGSDLMNQQGGSFVDAFSTDDEIVEVADSIYEDWEENTKPGCEECDDDDDCEHVAEDCGPEGVGEYLIECRDSLGRPDLSDPTTRFVWQAIGVWADRFGSAPNFSAREEFRRAYTATPEVPFPALVALVNVTGKAPGPAAIAQFIALTEAGFPGELIAAAFGPAEGAA